MTNFATNLKRLMILNNQSQKQVANSVGVSEASVSYWIHGREPKAGHLAALAAHFNCSIDWMLNQPEVK